MLIADYTSRPEAAREESLKLFITAVQAAPEAVQKGLSGEKFAEYLINGAQKIMVYINPVKS